MKNKDYTIFGLPLAVLLIGLISAPPAWAVPAGKLVAWGNNQYGQTNVPAGNNFVAIDASQGFHSLALRSDGSLAGWGSNYGDPILGAGDIFYGQAIVPAGNDFKAIAAGAFHSLALKSDGSLVGWGSNEVFGHDANPTGQATVPSGKDFVAIAAGDFYSLALKSDGSLVAWGDNSTGQLDVPLGNDFVAIASGDFFGLALQSDGSLVGWGWNYGEEASGTGGTFYGQATPPVGTNFVAISAGFEYSLAIHVAIERPVLNIARVGNSVVLSWPTDQSGYTLEAKTDPSSSLNWSNVFGTPTLVGNQYTVTNSVTNGNLFYRLKK